MDFALSADQVALADATCRFAQDVLGPGAVERAHQQGYPFDIARKLAEQGLSGITISTADGGQGGTLLDAIVVIQAVAEACPRSGDVIQATNFGAIRTLAEYGSAHQKNKYLSRLLAGDAVLSLGMTEADAGSAVTDLRTTARRHGEQVVISGSKVFSSHSADADLFLVYVRFGPGADGIGSVLIERGTPGFIIGKPASYMSGERWCPLYFDNATIPADNIVLGPGGFKQQIATFNVERLGNAARSLALGRLAFSVAREHALSHHQFGRPLAEFQGIQWKFADMAVKLESAQLLLYRAVSAAGDALPSAVDTALAKLASNMAGFEVANEAMQVMGGTGYTQESLVEYCVRRTRGWMIAGGSTEMMKNRVAESIFGRRFSQRPSQPSGRGG